MTDNTIMEKVEKLIAMHKSGKLGGKFMPEDSNPHLKRDSPESFLYFTLPMALNYQRNSYVLWQNALKTYEDIETADVFAPKSVVVMSEEELRRKLVKYRVALQPNRHVEIWKTISTTLVEKFNGDIRNLFEENNYDVVLIKDFIGKNRKAFPYLAGNKICNYWLYVIEQYTETAFSNRSEINVAPDTHVIHASLKLGLISNEEYSKHGVAKIVEQRWKELLANSKFVPIDIHTPLWLWSRGGFAALDV